MTTPQDPYGQPPQDPNQPPAYPPPPPGYGAPPPGYGPPPPGFGGEPQSNTPMVLGIIGIVLALCCWPAGLTLGILSYNGAKKQGGNTVLGIVAIVLAALNGVVSLAMLASGNGFTYYSR